MAGHRLPERKDGKKQTGSVEMMASDGSMYRLPTYDRRRRFRWSWLAVAAFIVGVGISDAHLLEVLGVGRWLSLAVGCAFSTVWWFTGSPKRSLRVMGRGISTAYRCLLDGAATLHGFEKPLGVKKITFHEWAGSQGTQDGMSYDEWVELRIPTDSQMSEARTKGYLERSVADRQRELAFEEEERIWAEIRLLDRACFAIETGNCIGYVVEGPDGWELAATPRVCGEPGFAGPIPKCCPIHGERYRLRHPKESPEAFARALAAMPGRRLPPSPVRGSAAQEAARVRKALDTHGAGLSMAERRRLAEAARAQEEWLDDMQARRVEHEEAIRAAFDKPPRGLGRREDGHSNERG